MMSEVAIVFGLHTGPEVERLTYIRAIRVPIKRWALWIDPRWLPES